MRSRTPLLLLFLLLPHLLVEHGAVGVCLASGTWHTDLLPRNGAATPVRDDRTYPSEAPACPSCCTGEETSTPQPSDAPEPECACCTHLLLGLEPITLDSSAKPDLPELPASDTLAPPPLRLQPATPSAAAWRARPRGRPPDTPQNRQPHRLRI